MKVRGALKPDVLYRREEIERLVNIDSLQLMYARRSGLVKPIELNRRMYYRGDELIEWICSHREGQGDGEE